MVNSLSAYTRVSPPVVYLMGLVVRKWLFDTQASRCWEREETRIEKLAQFGDAKPFNHLGIILNLVRLTARNSANFSLSFQFAPSSRKHQTSNSLERIQIIGITNVLLLTFLASFFWYTFNHPCHDSCFCRSSAPRPLSVFLLDLLPMS